MPRRSLRPYQIEAIDNVRELGERGIYSSLIHMGTGLGKTVTLIELTRQLFPPQFKRTIFMSPSLSLISQGYDNYIDQWPELSTMRLTMQNTVRPGIGKVQGNNDTPDARIIIGSYQTLIDKDVNPDDLGVKLERKDIDVDRHGNILLSTRSSRTTLISKRFDAILANGGMIDCLIIDEAHHAPANSTLFMIRRLQQLDELLDRPPLSIVGATATPIRTDQRSLANIFQAVAISRSWRFGQDNGYLVPFATPKRVYTEWGSIKNVGNWAEMIVKGWKEYGENRPSIAFTSPVGEVGSVEASMMLAAEFNKNGIPAYHLDGMKCVDENGDFHPVSYRETLFDGYRSGKYQVQCSYGVGLEGLDLPNSSCLIWARRTDSTILFPQAVGRILRLSPETNKKDALVLDFTGETLELAENASLMGFRVDPERELLRELTPEEVAEEDTYTLMDGEELETGERRLTLGRAEQILSHEIEIQSKSTHDWFIDRTTLAMSMSLNQDDILVVLPPNFPRAVLPKSLLNETSIPSDWDENKRRQFIHFLNWTYTLFSNFTLWHIRKGNLAHPNGWTQYNPDLDMLEALTVDYINQQNIDVISKWVSKRANFKKLDPTPDQLNWLRRNLPQDQYEYYMSASESLTRGKVGNLITHYIGYRPIQQRITHIENILNTFSGSIK